MLRAYLIQKLRVINFPNFSLKWPKTVITQSLGSPQGHAAQAPSSPYELDQSQGPEVGLEFGHDKSPLNLSS